MFDYFVNVFYGDDEVAADTFIAINSAGELVQRIKDCYPSAIGYQVMRVVTNSSFWNSTLEAVGFQRVVNL